MTSVPSDGHDGHVPGRWPSALQRMQAEREAATARHRDETKARFHNVLNGVRDILDDQPTPRTVRAAGRRLCAAVTLLADDVAKHKAGGQ
ncbi:hypothetical protein ACWEO1_06245 [Kitasatospora cineracea]